MTAISRDKGTTGGGLPAPLLKKIALLVGLVAASRVGVYDRLPGVDVARFSEAVASNGLLGYIDSITGGSISNVGVFSLGIIPAINASIFLQIMTISFPELKKLQREEGPQGRARYQLYQKLATLGFATAQAFGQLSAIKCVLSISSVGIIASTVTHLAGPATLSLFSIFAQSRLVPAMECVYLGRRVFTIVNQLADYISKLELCNGTSGLVFVKSRVFLFCSGSCSHTCPIFCRPYVVDFSPEWVLGNSITLVAGAMIVNQLADYISELKLGNGTSVLIFANIASYLPSSIGAAFSEASGGASSVSIYLIAFLLTTYAIVCVQVSSPLLRLP
jgi:preprotein translocase subunit SecY